MRARDPISLRASVEARLGNRATELDVDVNRLRRHHVFQRILVRLAADGRWVLKGGFALEARLLTDARATKDLDLAILDNQTGSQVRELLIEALDNDADGDDLSFSVGKAASIAPDPAGAEGWRFSVEARMAGRTFSTMRLDVVARPEEIAGGIETIVVSPLVPLEGFGAADMPAVDLAQHAAEKLHALTRTYGDRPNTRVKDLVDIVLLHEAGLLDPSRIASRLRVVQVARGGTWPPSEQFEPPAAWRSAYETFRSDLGLVTDYDSAVAFTAHLHSEATTSGEPR